MGSFMPQLFYSLYSLNRKLRGPLCRSKGGAKEEKSFHSPYRELNPGCPARNQVTILTELILMMSVDTFKNFFHLTFKSC